MSVCECVEYVIAITNTLHTESRTMFWHGTVHFPLTINIFLINFSSFFLHRSKHSIDRVQCFRFVPFILHISAVRALKRFSVQFSNAHIWINCNRHEIVCGKIIAENYVLIPVETILQHFCGWQTQYRAFTFSLTLSLSHSNSNFIVVVWRRFRIDWIDADGKSELTSCRLHTPNERDDKLQYLDAELVWSRDLIHSFIHFIRIWLLTIYVSKCEWNVPDHSSVDDIVHVHSMLSCGWNLYTPYA